MVPPVIPAAAGRPAAATLGDEFILLGPAGSRPFRASDLEVELRSMWRIASVEGPAAGRAVYRAALANLVVPLDAPGLRALSSVLVEVTRRHPCRLFLIETGAGVPEGSLRARATALCHLRPGHAGAVCSEQFVLQPGRGAEPLVPSAVRSLIFGELPVVLLDIHPGAPDPWREELWTLADLALGDSGLADGTADDLAGGAADGASLWDRIAREGANRIHDIAWARLTPWREILAELFDEPSLGGCLEGVQEVEIAHGGEGDEHPAAPALLLAGWLGARLGWAPERRQGRAVLHAARRGPVRVLFRHDPEDGTRTITGIRIRAGAPRPLSLEVVRHGRDPRAAVRIDEPGTERREIPFHYREFAACIVGEIQRHEPNPTLADAAATAQALSRAWTGGA